MVLGYLIHGLAPPATSVPASARASDPPSRASNGSLPAIDEIGAPLEAALKSDPGNTDLLIQLGNLYSDHRVYLKAIQYYKRALKINPQNVKVRTDLGTAYWYSGFPDKAVSEYNQSLSIDPSHFQTLFNLGVVYEKGLKDYSRAISAWNKLLEFHPQSPDRNRVERMIESARQEEAASKPQ